MYRMFCSSLHFCVMECIFLSFLFLLADFRTILFSDVSVYLLLAEFSDNIVFRCVGLFIYLFIYFVCFFVCLFVCRR